MTDEYMQNVSAAVASVEGVILNDLGVSSGVNPAMAQTHVGLQMAFLRASTDLGRPVSFADGYIMGIITALAKLLTVDPRAAGAAFEEIAAHAIGGSAHARTALDAEAKAQAAQEATNTAQAAQAAEMAPKPPTGGRRPSQTGMTAQGVAQNGAQANAAYAQSQAANATQAGQAASQDPRERAPGAYAADPASEYGATGFDADGRAEG